MTWKLPDSDKAWPKVSTGLPEAMNRVANNFGQHGAPNHMLNHQGDHFNVASLQGMLGTDASNVGNSRNSQAQFNVPGFQGNEVGTPPDPLNFMGASGLSLSNVLKRMGQAQGQLSQSLSSAFARAPAKPQEVPTVSLQALRLADSLAVKAAFAALNHHGFAWLDFGRPDRAGDTTMGGANDSLSNSSEYLAEIGDFLALNEHGGSPHAMEGHFSAAHKDGLRVVTGSCINQNLSLPEKIQEKLTRLALDLDEAQRDVIKALVPSFYFNSPADIGEYLDIPLLCPETAESGFRQYGLLDVVRYHANGPAEVVAPHVDPGLFILSLPCGVPGLQLQDAFGEWRAPPAGLGVLWAGQAAEQLHLKSGMHRVVSSPTARLSAWHEMCTRSQLCPPMLQVLEEHSLELKLGTIRGTREVLRFLQASEDYLNVNMVERRGVPVGKSGAIIKDMFVPWRLDSHLHGLPHFPGHAKKSQSAPPLPDGAVEIVPKL